MRITEDEDELMRIEDERRQLYEEHEEAMGELKRIKSVMNDSMDIDELYDAKEQRKSCMNKLLKCDTLSSAGEEVRSMETFSHFQTNDDAVSETSLGSSNEDLPSVTSESSTTSSCSAMMPIGIFGPDGNPMEVMIDTGASYSVIDEKVVRRLGLSILPLLGKPRPLRTGN